MSLLIYNLLLSVILLGIGDSTIVMALKTSNEPDTNTDFGGLSAESTDIAGANKTDLINGTNNNNDTDLVDCLLDLLILLNNSF